MLLTAAICGPIAVHFLLCLNLSHTNSWPQDASTKEAMSIIEEKTRDLPEPASVSNIWQLEPAMNYYITSRKINVNPANRDGFIPGTDFQYGFDQGFTAENYTELLYNKYDRSYLVIKIKN